MGWILPNFDHGALKIDQNWFSKIDVIQTALTLSDTLVISTTLPTNTYPLPVLCTQLCQRVIKCILSTESVQNNRKISLCLTLREKRILFFLITDIFAISWPLEEKKLFLGQVRAIWMQFWASILAEVKESFKNKINYCAWKQIKFINTPSISWT